MRSPLTAPLWREERSKPVVWLAIHPNGDQRAVPGEPTRDPTHGPPALWIDESQRERAQAARFTLVDLPTVLTTHPRMC